MKSIIKSLNSIYSKIVACIILTVILTGSFMPVFELNKVYAKKKYDGEYKILELYDAQGENLEEEFAKWFGWNEFVKNSDFYDYSEFGIETEGSLFWKKNTGRFIVPNSFASWCKAHSNLYSTFFYTGTDLSYIHWNDFPFIKKLKIGASDKYEINLNNMYMNHLTSNEPPFYQIDKRCIVTVDKEESLKRMYDFLKEKVIGDFFINVKEENKTIYYPNFIQGEGKITINYIFEEEEDHNESKTVTGIVGQKYDLEINPITYINDEVYVPYKIIYGSGNETRFESSMGYFETFNAGEQTVNIYYKQKEKYKGKIKVYHQWGNEVLLDTEVYEGEDGESLNIRDLANEKDIDGVKYIPKSIVHEIAHMNASNDYYMNYQGGSVDEVVIRYVVAERDINKADTRAKARRNYTIRVECYDENNDKIDDNLLEIHGKVGESFRIEENQFKTITIHGIVYEVVEKITDDFKLNEFHGSIFIDGIYPDLPPNHENRNYKVIKLKYKKVGNKTQSYLGENTNNSTVINVNAPKGKIIVDAYDKNGKPIKENITSKVVSMNSNFTIENEDFNSFNLDHKEYQFTGKKFSKSFNMSGDKKTDNKYKNITGKLTKVDSSNNIHIKLQYEQIKSPSTGQSTQKTEAQKKAEAEETARKQQIDNFLVNTGILLKLVDYNQNDFNNVISWLKNGKYTTFINWWNGVGDCVNRLNENEQQALVNALNEIIPGGDFRINRTTTVTNYLHRTSHVSYNYSYSSKKFKITGSLDEQVNDESITHPDVWVTIWGPKEGSSIDVCLAGGYNEIEYTATMNGIYTVCAEPLTPDYEGRYAPISRLVYEVKNIDKEAPKITACEEQAVDDNSRIEGRKIYIEAKDNMNLKSVTIYNLEGTAVASSNISGTKDSAELSIRHPGTYKIVVEDASGNKTEKNKKITFDSTLPKPQGEPTVLINGKKSTTKDGKLIVKENDEVTIKVKANRKIKSIGYPMQNVNGVEKKPILLHCLKSDFGAGNRELKAINSSEIEYTFKITDEIIDELDLKNSAGDIDVEILYVRDEYNQEAADGEFYFKDLLYLDDKTPELKQTILSSSGDNGRTSIDKNNQEYFNIEKDASYTLDMSFNDELKNPPTVKIGEYEIKSKKNNDRTGEVYTAQINSNDLLANKETANIKQNQIVPIIIENVEDKVGHKAESTVIDNNNKTENQKALFYGLNDIEDYLFVGVNSNDSDTGYGLGDINKDKLINNLDLILLNYYINNPDKITTVMEMI